MTDEQSLCSKWSRGEVHAPHTSLLTWCPGITAPVVPEQPQLPTEPGTHWLDKDGGYWFVLPSGKLTDPADVDETNGDPAQYAPFTRLVPAGSERGTAQNAVIAFLEAHTIYSESGFFRGAVDDARAHFALVPEAEGKK